MAKIIGIIALAIFFFLLNVAWTLIQRLLMNPLQRKTQSMILKKEHDDYTYKVFLQAAREGKDYTDILDKDFNKAQLSQIAMGIKQGLDVRQYSDPSLDEEQMRSKRMEMVSK